VKVSRPVLYRRRGGRPPRRPERRQKASLRAVLYNYNRKYLGLVAIRLSASGLLISVANQAG
jgi:hypothetical protein